MTPLGLGGDGLGSLRWPAQCCGITTLKATYGRIPAAGDMQMGAQLAVVDGPMGPPRRRPLDPVRGDGRTDLA